MRRRYVSSPVRDFVVIVPPLSTPLEVTSLEQSCHVVARTTEIVYAAHIFRS
jgi:hypothetical protein